MSKFNPIPSLDSEACDMIRELCIACGLGIDKIAKQKNLPQNMVAKLFLKSFELILKRMEVE